MRLGPSPGQSIFHYEQRRDLGVLPLPKEILAVHSCWVWCHLQVLYLNTWSPVGDVAEKGCGDFWRKSFSGESDWGRLGISTAPLGASVPILPATQLS